MKKTSITSDLPVTDEIILNNKTGILVKSKDPRALSNAMYTLLNDESKRQQLGNDAYSFVK